MPEHSRRAFVVRAAGAAAAIGLPRETLLAAPPTSARPFRAQYAMCNETFAEWPQDKIFKFLAECGYAGVEIAPYTIHTDVRQIAAPARAALRKSADAASLQIIGLHWLLAKTEGFHLTSPDPQVRAKTADYLAELARFCRDLGGNVMVFGSPKQRNLLPGVTREQGMQHAAAVLRALVPVLEKTRVTLALEPLGRGTTNFLQVAADAVELAQMVASPFCRLHLDCKAMGSESRPIPDVIREHASWLVHFHANDPNNLGPGMGQLDFVPIFRALRDVDYRGWVSVEVFNFSPGPERIARESIQYMRKVQAALEA